MKNRTAKVRWTGGLKEGRGEITTESGALTQVPFSFGTRFEDEPGTNPEELIAAAHAACFSMALSAELQKLNLTAEAIDVRTFVKIEKGDDGWLITNIHLKVEAKVPDCTPSQLQSAANITKVKCPVSRVLKAEITMDASLSKSSEKTVTSGAI